MNSRRQFVLEGLKQAGWIFGVLLLLVSFAELLLWTVRIWHVTAGGITYGIVHVTYVLAVVTTICGASVLFGPIPKCLTFFDISDKQLLILTFALMVVYWACFGAAAGLLRWKMSASIPEQWQTASLKKNQKYTSWAVGTLAVVLALISFPSGPIAGTAMISNGRNSPQFLIINNLRQIDSAKNEFIYEKKLPLAYIVMEADLIPYLKLKDGKLPHVGPEHYVLNPLNQPVYAVLDSNWRIPRRGWHEGFTFTNGTIFRLP